MIASVERMKQQKAENLREKKEFEEAWNRCTKKLRSESERQV